jgi:hypothetical protein
MFLSVTTGAQRLEVLECVAPTVGLWDDVVDIEADIIDTSASNTTLLTDEPIAAEHLLPPTLPVRWILFRWILVVPRCVVLVATQHILHSVCTIRFF